MFLRGKHYINTTYSNFQNDFCNPECCCHVTSYTSSRALSESTKSEKKFPDKLIFFSGFTKEWGCKWHTKSPLESETRKALKLKLASIVMISYWKYCKIHYFTLGDQAVVCNTCIVFGHVEFIYEHLDSLHTFLSGQLNEMSLFGVRIWNVRTIFQ